MVLSPTDTACTELALPARIVSAVVTVRNVHHTLLIASIIPCWARLNADTYMIFHLLTLSLTSNLGRSIILGPIPIWSGGDLDGSDHQLDDTVYANTIVKERVTIFQLLGEEGKLKIHYCCYQGPIDSEREEGMQLPNIKSEVLQASF